MTIGDEDFPFVIDTCNTEPGPETPLPEPLIGTSVTVFEIRGAAQIEGQEVEARLIRTEGSTTGVSDLYGWAFFPDLEEPNSWVIVGTKEGSEAVATVEQTAEGITFYGPPTPFERREGFDIVDDVDPGMGSIIATC